MMDLRVLLGTLATLTLVGGATVVTYDRVYSGGFHAEFCVTITKAMNHWKAHLLFDRPVDSVDAYTAVVESKLDGGKEYILGPKSYNGQVAAGGKLCMKLAAHVSGSTAPHTVFFIEHYDEPAGHVVPTTPVPGHTGHGQFLWQKQDFDVQDPLNGFDSPKHGAFDEDSLSVVKDPAGGSGNVLRVYYEKDHYIHKRPHRGAQFYSAPVSPRTSMTLTYDVYFSPGFPWTLGGKLPGLYGGADCSGGRHPDDCFSARLMWRTDGDGEAYLYIPKEQEAHFCERKDVHCNSAYGDSVGRGSWRFKAGQWQTISEHITLNTPGHNNGIVKVFLDDKMVYHGENINFRKIDSVLINGLFFSTFFGGSSQEWAPNADCYTYYKNFRISDTATGVPTLFG